MCKYDCIMYVIQTNVFFFTLRGENQCYLFFELWKGFLLTDEFLVCDVTAGD